MHIAHAVCTLSRMLYTLSRKLAGCCHCVGIWWTDRWIPHLDLSILTLNVSLQSISHAISHKWNYAPGCTAQGCCTHKHDGKYIRDIYLHQSSFVSHFLPHTYTDLDNTIHPGMNCHKRYANQITTYWEQFVFILFIYLSYYLTDGEGGRTNINKYRVIQ